MSQPPASTRERLITSAARLFRQNGYHGTGLAQVLSDSHAPKGSLYHHFPNGKSDLAMASASWVSGGVIRIIDDAFTPAPDFATGATTFCHKLAKLFEVTDDWQSCPITSMLFDGPDNQAFLTHADHLLSSWSARCAEHGRRLGMTQKDADAAAELLLLTIQGAWTLARARQSADVIRRIPKYIYV